MGVPAEEEAVVRGVLVKAAEADRVVFAARPGAGLEGAEAVFARPLAVVRRRARLLAFVRKLDKKANFQEWNFCN